MIVNFCHFTIRQREEKKTVVNSKKGYKYVGIHYYMKRRSLRRIEESLKQN